MRASARNAIFAAVAICLALAPAACGSAGGEQAPTPVTMELVWTHQAQFAGFYVADQKGYYSDEGLAVTFVEGGPAGGQVESVLSEAAQFGVVSADVLLIARSQGEAVQAVAAIYRRSPRVYMSLAQSGITGPKDLAGKTIAVNKAAQPTFAALMSRVGVSAAEYTVVDTTPDMEQLYSGAVQARSVYLTNEVLAAKRAGHDVTVMYPDDYGIHNYGDVLFASQKLIAADPDLVQRFVRATLAGWTYAVEHPAEMGAMVAIYKPDADVQIENDKMAASIPLVSTGEDHIGWMNAETWTGTEKTLRDGGVITAPLDITQVFTMKFLEEIYK